MSLTAPSTSTTDPSAPLTGKYLPTQLSSLFYGPGSVHSNLLFTLPSPSSKAFIITTTSLTKTPLISQLESLLSKQTPNHYAGTFSSISQHAPVAQLDKATDAVRADPSIDTLIAVGGGSPIDSAKAISYRLHENTGKYLHLIVIPTTLSVAECTGIAGYTNTSGLKTGVMAPELVPKAIFYDADYVAGYTPPHLYLSTGIRALDHAVELSYHPMAAEAPTKALCREAIKDLFTYLPLHKEKPEDKEIITRLQLASFNSLHGIGLGVKGGLGLSHTLGYALGSPYGIPHGVTSCLTLAGVVRVQAERDEWKRGQIARLRGVVGKGEQTGDDGKDAEVVSVAIGELVERLGLKTTLGEKGVGEDQVGRIVELGTGGDKGDLGKRVEGLVRSLL